MRFKELLVYSQTEDQKWELEWQRSLPAPILSLCQVSYILMFFRFFNHLHHIFFFNVTVFYFFPLEMHLYSPEEHVWPGGHDWWWIEGACGGHNQGGSGALWKCLTVYLGYFCECNPLLSSQEVCMAECLLFMRDFQVLQADLSSVKEVTLERLRSLVSALP